MFCLGEKQARKYDKNAILVALDKQNPKNNLYVVKEQLLQSTQILGVQISWLTRGQE